MMRSSSANVLLLLVGILACPHAAAQTTVCDDESVDIVSGALMTREIEFVERLIVTDVTVMVEITHGFIGDLGIAIDDPHGTRVVLFDGLELDDDAQIEESVSVTFDSAADVRTSEWDCECAAAPIGNLDVYTDIDPAGTWVLTVEDYLTPDDGTLDEWCLEVTGCGEVVRLETPTCHVDEDEVTLSWSAENYEEVTIFRLGEELETLVDGETEYTETLEVGITSYHLVAYDEDGDCESTSVQCEAEFSVQEDCRLVGVAGVWEFSGPGTIRYINNVTDIVEDPVEMSVGIEVIEVFFGLENMVFEVENPAGDTLVLHDQEGGGAKVLNRSYADVGSPSDQVDFDCECFVTPAGPGTLDDLLLDDETGSWWLNWSAVSADAAELERFCLRFYGDESIPDPDPEEPIFVRGDADANGTVSVLLDSLFILEYLFRDGDEPDCMDAADVNDNEFVSITDALYLLSYGFADGPEPDSPFFACDEDPTGDEEDDVGCEFESEECS